MSLQVDTALKSVQTLLRKLQLQTHTTQLKLENLKARCDSTVSESVKTQLNKAVLETGARRQLYENQASDIANVFVNTTTNKETIQTSRVTGTYAHAQNTRTHMEDQKIYDLNYTLDEKSTPSQHLMLVTADGHSGEEAAKFFSSQFAKRLSKTYTELNKTTSESTDIGEAMKKCFQGISNNWDEVNNPILNEHADDSGSTFAACVVNKTTGNGALLNIGDSRVMLFDMKTSNLILQTTDHDFSDPKEIKDIEKRILKSDRTPCFVSDDHGTLRVQGRIAMSRAGGDNSIDIFGCMNHEADVTPFTLKKDNETAIVVASDGLLDEFKIDEIAKMACVSRLTATEVARKAIQKGAVGDNITVLIVYISIGS
jgi:serine/threonine protein phosphatase PrpC